VQKPSLIGVFSIRFNYIFGSGVLYFGPPCTCVYIECLKNVTNFILNNCNKLEPIAIILCT